MSLPEPPKDGVAIVRAYSTGFRDGMDAGKKEAWRTVRWRCRSVRLTSDFNDKTLTKQLTAHDRAVTWLKGSHD